MQPVTGSSLGRYTGRVCPGADTRMQVPGPLEQPVIPPSVT